MIFQFSQFPQFTTCTDELLNFSGIHNSIEFAFEFLNWIKLKEKYFLNLAWNSGNRCYGCKNFKQLHLQINLNNWHCSLARSLCEINRLFVLAGPCTSLLFNSTLPYDCMDAHPELKNNVLENIFPCSPYRLLGDSQLYSRIFLEYSRNWIFYLKRRKSKDVCGESQQKRGTFTRNTKCSIKFT